MTEVIWRQVLLDIALADRYTVSLPIINSSAAPASYAPAESPIEYVLSTHARGSLPNSHPVAPDSFHEIFSGGE